MGGTSGEGCPPSLSGWNLQDGGDDAGIGGEYRNDCGHYHQGSLDENDKFIGRSVCTREFEKGWDVTEEMVNYIGAKER